MTKSAKRTIERILSVSGLCLLIFLSLFGLFTAYGFLILQGEALLLVMAMPPTVMFCGLVDLIIKRRLFYYSSTTIMFVFLFTLLYVTGARGTLETTIIVKGRVTGVANTMKYVHFVLDSYPQVTFKSYDPAIREIFLPYNFDNNNEKISTLTNKRVQLEVKKQHLEWVQRPSVAILQDYRFPLEVEVQSLEVLP
jgi:hypothetical protein